MACILAYVLDIEACILVALFMSLFLNRKIGETEKKWYIIVQISVILIIPESIRFFLGQNRIWNWILFLLVIVTMRFCIQFFFCDSISKKIAILTICFIIYGYITYAGTSIDFAIDGNQSQSILVNKVINLGIRNLLTIIFVCVISIIWKRIYTQDSVNIKYLFLYFTFPLGQILILNYYNIKELITVDGLSYLSALGAIVGILANIILLYTFLEQRNREVIQQKIQEMENSVEIEEMQNAALDKEKEEINNIRREFMDQLDKVYDAIKCDNAEKGKAILKSLYITHADTKEKNYCKDPVINAVLIDKLHICEKYNIFVDIEISLDTDLLMNPVEICSLYCNLLDNAIHAVNVSDVENRFIRIRTKMNGDYLTIKMINTASEESQKKDQNRQHLGQQIINDIVNRYQGQWCGKWDMKNNIYEATVTILARNTVCPIHN